MEEEAFNSNRQEATENMEDEFSRTRAGFQDAGPRRPPPSGTNQPGNHPLGSDPGLRHTPTPATTAYRPTEDQRSAAAEYIRKKCPTVADMPDAYLAGQNIDAVVRAIKQEEANEAATGSKNLEMKMHTNFKKAVESPVMVCAGMDNRADTLHPGRYIAAAGITVQQHWREGRKNWGPMGVPTISNYDMEAVGASGCITAKGWDALHHPGSPDICLKYFSVANVGQAASGARMVQLLGEEGISVSDNMKEVADMGELKLALRNLLRASRQAAYWNYSFEVLEGFLVAQDYLEKELSNIPKKAAIISNFVDHVLKTNAARYVQEAEFLDATRLASTWTAWWGARKTSSSHSSHNNSSGGRQNNPTYNNSSSFRGNNKGRRNNNGGNFNGGGRQNQWRNNFNSFQGGPEPRFSGPPSAENICRRFNEGKCQNQASSCVVPNTRPPLRLYHLCNWLIKKDGEKKSELCKQRHRRINHEDFIKSD